MQEEPLQVVWHPCQPPPHQYPHSWGGRDVGCLRTIQLIKELSKNTFKNILPLNLFDQPLRLILSKDSLKKCGVCSKPSPTVPPAQVMCNDWPVQTFPLPCSVSSHKAAGNVSHAVSSTDKSSAGQPHRCTLCIFCGLFISLPQCQLTYEVYHTN